MDFKIYMCTSENKHYKMTTEDSCREGQLSRRPGDNNFTEIGPSGCLAKVTGTF